MQLRPHHLYTGQWFISNFRIFQSCLVSYLNFFLLSIFSSYHSLPDFFSDNLFNQVQLKCKNTFGEIFRTFSSKSSKLFLLCLHTKSYWQTLFVLLAHLFIKEMTFACGGGFSFKKVCTFFNEFFCLFQLWLHFWLPLSHFC